MGQARGFTLIEIIVVIVILGVLATLALPRISGQREAALAAEAMQTFGVIKRAALDCYDMTVTMTSCDQGTDLNVQLPQPARFRYEVLSTDTALIVTASIAKNTALYLSMRVSANGVVNFNAPAGSVFVGIVNRTKVSASFARGVQPF